jgi:hypothetical protein
MNPHHFLVWPLLAFLFYLYGVLFLQTYRYSIFSSSAIQELELKSSKRLAAALDYFHVATPSRAIPSVSPEYCIAMVTTPRPERYFLQTMHALLLGLRVEPNPDQVQLHIVEASSSTTASTSDDVTMVTPFVDVVRHHSTMFPSRQRQRDWLTNEISTYILALESCRRTNSTWTIVVEDDGLARKDFFVHLQHLLQQLNERNKRRLALGSIKLFQTEFYFGWEKKDLGFLMLMGLAGAMVGGSLVVFVSLATAKVLVQCDNNSNSNINSNIDDSNQKYKRRRRWYNHCTDLYWHSSCFGLLVVVVLLALGKQHVIAPYDTKGTFRFLDEATMDSNTVATVYATNLPTQQQLLPVYLSTYLMSVQGDDAVLPLDMLVNQWAVANNLDRYYHVPSLFQHIGFYSISQQKRRWTQHLLRRHGGAVTSAFKQSSTFGSGKGKR